MPTLVVSITLFVLALLIGIEVIGKVPATLHTPLMSGANSIHGIVIVGVVIVAGEAHSPRAYGCRSGCSSSWPLCWAP